MQDFVACTVQQQVKIFDSPLEYQADIFEFLQDAWEKRANLVVFPALSPLMLIPSLALTTEYDLEEEQKNKGNLSGIVGKLLGKGDAATETTDSLQDKLLRLIQDHPGELYDAYIDLFSAAALRYQLTIVAGSFYLREHEEAACTHVSYVFAPSGMVLGRQEKIHLSPAETNFCEPGQALQVIETPVGRIGILIEEDVLYPECGRILAYEGAEILINLTAAVGTQYNRLRNALLARVDENELLGVQSCLTGTNLLDPAAGQLAGKSALLQPFELSKRGNGIMTEIKSAGQEGLIAGHFSLEQLKDYWFSKPRSLRRSMNMQTYRPLADVYFDKHTLDQSYRHSVEDDADETSGITEARRSQPPTSLS